MNNRDHQRLKDHIKGAYGENLTHAIGFIGEVLHIAQCTQRMPIFCAMGSCYSKYGVPPPPQQVPSTLIQSFWGELKAKMPGGTSFSELNQLIAETARARNHLSYQPRKKRETRKSNVDK